MMTGTITVTKLREFAPYYTATDYDERLGGKFTMVIEPLQGFGNERFYYARKLDNGKIELSGEGYICTNTASVERHKKEARKDLEGMLLIYCWVDESGKIVKRTNR